MRTQRSWQMTGNTKRRQFLATGGLLLLRALPIAASPPIPPNHPTQETPSMQTIWMTAGQQRFETPLDENPTTRAFIQFLPAIYEMTELNGNEKYVTLPSSLPSNAKEIGKIETGDLLLYGDNTLVIFYQTFSSRYRYTRIGKVKNPAALAAALGPGNVQVSFTPT